MIKTARLIQKAEELLKDPRALAAPALRMYWWYRAAMAAPMKGPTQNIHCKHRIKEKTIRIIIQDHGLTIEPWFYIKS